MIDIEQLKIVLQGITALAALIRLRRETQKQEREPSTTQMADAAKNEVSTVGFDHLRFSVSKSTLDSINVVIDRARKRFEDALRDPANNKQARDAEEQIAQSTICGELKRIKRLNGGNLPPDYEVQWGEFSCA